MHSPYVRWDLVVDATKPQAPQFDGFAAWFIQQDPAQCSEKDRVLMTNHLMEHLVSKSTSVWPAQPATARKTLQADPRIQSELNKWLHAWDWSLPCKFYRDVFSAAMWHTRSQDWVEHSLNAKPLALFNVQLMCVLENEYWRSNAVEQGNRALLCQTGYSDWCEQDAPEGAMLRQFLTHWEKTHGSLDLHACQDVLEMLHPRPPLDMVNPGAESTRNALFQGFKDHLARQMAPTGTLDLPDNVLDIQP